MGPSWGSAQLKPPEWWLLVMQWVGQATQARLDVHPIKGMWGKVWKALCPHGWVQMWELMWRQLPVLQAAPCPLPRARLLPPGQEGWSSP